MWYPDTVTITHGENSGKVHNLDYARHYPCKKELSNRFKHPFCFHLKNKGSSAAGLHTQWGSMDVRERQDLWGIRIFGPAKAAAFSPWNKNKGTYHFPAVLKLLSIWKISSNLTSWLDITPEPKASLLGLKINSGFQTPLLNSRDSSVIIYSYFHTQRHFCSQNI